MEFALVDGERREAKPDLAGTCLVCGQRMISKCGSKVLWHWAHYGRRHCDPWWENETEWHRSWKACFPEVWREQVHFDGSGQKHVADVRTPSGMVLEFQNSTMPPEELHAREKFYGKMLWIVNGAPFISQFFILGRIPSTEVEWTGDIVFLPQRRDRRGRCFWRKSENPGYKPGDMFLVHGVDEIQNEIDRDYVGHHLYDWVRPRSVWLESLARVYIDFGGDLLWHMQRFGDGELQCVQAIRKRSLISLHGGEYAETGKIVCAAKRPRRNGDVADKGETEVIPSLIR
jgi:competence protein CoiA